MPKRALQRTRDLFGTRVVKGKRREEEFKFQAALVQFLNLALPADAVLVHIPNGGPNPAFRAKSAALGVLPGAPDLVIFWNRRSYGLECKAREGSRSADQISTHARLEAAGVELATVRTIETAEMFLRRWGLPLRGSVAA